MTQPPTIPARDRLIFALDVPDRAAALAWMDRLGDSVSFYKIGLELLAGGDWFVVLDELAARGKRIFADLKFHDVPATVAGAVRGLATRPITFATVHCDSRAMLEAAATAKGALRLLAVTVLTSNDRDDLASLGVRGEPAEIVIERARLAQAAGIDGVVCSGADLPRLRGALGPDLLTVCPGIRPAGPGRDDQKRTVDVPTAFARGADYIVVGRPIRNAPDPRAAADAIVAQIAAARG
ncbi:MAG TPA: orotidine-5'-phosphate decarboxylase [Rhodanobacteraceae bacterium]|jgi:orotidine-5'-phosphate decarboxylase|nr:orotidine-5'-phosphate decarboxylase [Rhodanobacteraceae bacterium]